MLQQEGVMDLTLALVAINGWNRLAVTFRQAVVTYQPREVQK